MPEELIIALVVLPIMATAWSGTVYLSSRVTDWRRFRAAFPEDHPPQSYSASLRTGCLGLSVRALMINRYRYMLKLHASERGLHMAMILPMRPGHPPVCIPWAALQFHQGDLEGFDLPGLLRVEFRGGAKASGYVQLDPNTIEQLKLRDWIRGE